MERIWYDVEEIKWLGWVLYGVVALIWSAFAASTQQVLYGSGFWKCVLVFVVNFIFVPFAMVIAIYKDKMYEQWNQEDKEDV